MNNKDNPVPSLDKNLIDKYEDSFPGTLQDVARETLEYFIDWYNQNGVETNNEQPIYNLRLWTEDLIEEDASINTHIFHIPSEDECNLQFIGVELCLKSDGTYILIDTTGG